MRSSIRGSAMTDATLSAVPAAGRSLWGDAWLRLKGNKAAVISGIYLLAMTVACILGPYFTGHEFTTIYPDYVRVAPSLQPYPQGDQIEGALEDALKRGRIELASWRDESDRILTSTRMPPPSSTRGPRDRWGRASPVMSRAPALFGKRGGSQKSP